MKEEGVLMFAVSRRNTLFTAVLVDEDIVEKVNLVEPLWVPRPYDLVMSTVQTLVSLVMHSCRVLRVCDPLFNVHGDYSPANRFLPNAGISRSGGSLAKRRLFLVGSGGCGGGITLT